MVGLSINYLVTEVVNLDSCLFRLMGDTGISIRLKFSININSRVIQLIEETAICLSHRIWPLIPEIIEF